MDRRQFLTAAAAAGLVGISHRTKAVAAALSPASGKQAVLRLSIQEDKMPDGDFEAKLDRLERWGFAGIELRGKGLPDRVEQIKKALRGRSIKVSAVCTGVDGCLISDRPELRDEAMRSVKKILTAAGELEAVGLIVVPAFNRHSTLEHRKARELLTGFARWDEEQPDREKALLQELGDHAAKNGTRLLLEPLNRHECYFLRTLVDAASICRDVSNPGIAMMGDFWHMTWEEISDLGAFISAGSYLRHVHIASRRRRKMPGEDGEADNYLLGFAGLKWIGYQDYISMECGSIGDRDTTIPAAAELIRKQWNQA